LDSHPTSSFSIDTATSPKLRWSATVSDDKSRHRKLKYWLHCDNSRCDAPRVVHDVIHSGTGALTKIYEIKYLITIQSYPLRFIIVPELVDVYWTDFVLG
jgi:hypothetical protein